MSFVLQGLDLVALFDDTFFFLTFTILCFGLVGLGAQSFIFGIFTSFLAFVTLTVQTEYQFYEDLLIVVMVVTFFFVTFQIYNKTQDSGSGVDV